MASELVNLLSYIACRVIDTPGTFERIQLLGINYNDWPKSALAYDCMHGFAINLQDGETSAAWKACRSLFPERLGEIFGETDYPGDPRTIAVEYQRLMQKENAESLSVQISKTPERAMDLISEYLNYKSSSVNIVSFEDAISHMVETQEKAKAEGKQLVTIPNWPLLSDAIGGFNPGRMGVLVADTGFGKTNLGIQLAIDASTSMGTLYFNMEMIESDFTQRAVSCMENMRPKDFHGEWNVGRAKLRAKTRKLFYSTGKDLSLMEIQSACRAYKAKHDVQLIIVDYDQKIVLSGRDEEWKELQRASVALESIAKELNCYVLLLAQSNMDGGISGSKRATFSASQVFMFEKNKENQEEIIIRATKNRFGIRNASVKVDYEPASALVREKEKFVWIAALKKEYKKTSAKSE